MCVTGRLHEGVARVIPARTSATASVLPAARSVHTAAWNIRCASERGCMSLPTTGSEDSRGVGTKDYGKGVEVKGKASSSSGSRSGQSRGPGHATSPPSYCAPTFLPDTGDEPAEARQALPRGARWGRRQRGHRNRRRWRAISTEKHLAVRSSCSSWTGGHFRRTARTVAASLRPSREPCPPPRVLCGFSCLLSARKGQTRSADIQTLCHPVGVRGRLSHPSTRIALSRGRGGGCGSPQPP
jgi:hypothetical protein